MAVLLVVASGMLAEVYKYFKDEKVCDILKTFDSKAQCKYIITGVVSAFFTPFSDGRQRWKGELVFQFRSIVCIEIWEDKRSH